MYSSLPNSAACEKGNPLFLPAAISQCYYHTIPTVRRIQHASLHVTEYVVPQVRLWFWWTIGVSWAAILLTSYPIWSVIFESGSFSLSILGYDISTPNNIIIRNSQEGSRSGWGWDRKAPRLFSSMSVLSALKSHYFAWEKLASMVLLLLGCGEPSKFIILKGHNYYTIIENAFFLFATHPTSMCHRGNLTLKLGQHPIASPSYKSAPSRGMQQSPGQANSTISQQLIYWLTAPQSCMDGLVAFNH